MAVTKIEDVQDAIESTLIALGELSGSALTAAVVASCACHSTTAERARAMLINMGFIKTIGKPGHLVYRWEANPGPLNTVDTVNVVIRSEWERVAGERVEPFQWIVRELEVA